MIIKADASVKVQIGDFGVPSPNGFHVPVPHAKMLRKFGIQTVEGLYSLASQDPEGVAELYGWRVVDVETATVELREELEKSNPRFLAMELKPSSSFGLGYGINRTERE